VITGTNARYPAAEALAIATSALKYENLSDLTQILGEIGGATGSFAVLLWELAPGVDRADQNQAGQLFVLAGWLKNGDPFASHTLPLNSCTGAAILNNETVICKDVDKDNRVHRGQPDFFKKYGIRSFVSIPLQFGESEQGALNLYHAPEERISESNLLMATAFAQVLPGIYSGLRERSSLKVMAALNGVIQKYEGHQKRLELPTAKQALEEMATTISKGFRCLETSIYLIQADVEPNKAQVVATTFEPYIRQREYSVGAPGLTAWILKTAQPLRIFDLTAFERDQPIIQARYPGLSGFKEDRLVELTRTALNVGSDVNLQPLSFMAVPIVVGGALLGVIRCCTLLQAPYYYGERDEKLLSLVASQVGHYWMNWVQLGAIENENRSWESLVTSLNDIIHGISSRVTLDETKILKQFLHVARGVLPGADIFDVRLSDERRKYLYFAAREGKAWAKKDPELTNKQFPLDGRSAGAWVFKTNKPRIMLDVTRDELYNQTFPDVKSMVIAPISSGREQYGVLDVRITNSAGIPPNTPTIAEALGRQLGLYLHLARTLRKVGAVEKRLKENVARLEKSEAEREKVLEIQTRVFEDLEHQLKLPILQAHSRLSQLLAKTLPADKVMSNVQAVRGLLRKAERVVRGMSIFVTLAKNRILSRHLSRLSKGTLVKLLIEICMDCIFLEGHASRGLRFRVDDASFDILGSVDVQCDFDLLEQAIYDIVDNACKYSFPDQEILVRGGLNKHGKFYIAVIDKGLPLRLEDIPHVIERGWRGREALLSTGQGSGIGCWFAHQVMVAHQGQLILFPTNASKLTEARLQF
jgi:signal transduction histidine kinase